ncbi:glycerate kinase-like [Centruroides sculpturatus]|uniref:glycerate kinase-like n=1 Tax=Centruroides sculpturatus TaxID=218467 RepID=UPI000C6C8A5F|nr:glycerate kinase-like [Centruroides sculpturatus]XP_023221785.1 glycerate kinase-like [Centruroides sculpturatus]XP_023221795.1 glycerate kinase-like [Centruroides sculpturatus]
MRVCIYTKGLSYVNNRNIWRKVTTVFFRKYQNNLRMKTDILAMKTDAINIFKRGVDAVLPQQLISNILKLTEDRKLIIGDKSYDVNENVYLVGFGKAVSGMARAIEDILGHHLVKGIISVPIGIVKLMEDMGKNKMLPRPNGKIRLLEGAKDNIPDESAWQAATDIVSLVSGLDSRDLLIVLISGGGSALLPSPLPPVTLEEKQTLIKQLTSKGATIQELNSIRKRLSLVKGGGLAKLAYPTKVVSLILSDIVGDPIDLIASAPTVINKDPPDLSLKILQKYDLLEKIPSSVLKVLKKDVDGEESKLDFDHVDNVLIGNNRLSIEAAGNAAINLGYSPIILNIELTGVARNVGAALAKLGIFASGGDYTKDDLSELQRVLLLSNERIEEIIQKCKTTKSGICIISGGETVVLLKGNGRGGRNQEMALAALLTLSSLSPSSSSSSYLLDREIIFLSAGTDGIDGSTEAAGAIAYRGMSNVDNTMVVSYLENNDSYNFYRSINNGDDLVITGHTGTNVMDLQILLLR